MAERRHLNGTGFMRTCCLLAATLATIPATWALAASPAGDWLVAGRNAVVRIAPCNDAWCGKLSWTLTPGQDEHNPDAAKRNEQILGTTILIDMKPNGANRWDGQIYNPENGKTYTGHIVMLGPNRLRVEGCLLGILCGGEDWTRVNSPPASSSSSPKAGAGTMDRTPPGR